MKNIFMILSLFFIISCTNSKDRSMSAETEAKQVKQDSQVDTDQCMVLKCIMKFTEKECRLY